MVFGSGPQRGQIDFGLSGPIPRDVLVLIGATFLTYALGAFASTATLVRLLQLTPGLWQAGFLWQWVTYPFATAFFDSILGLFLSLWMMLMFGKQVFFFVGRRAFWRHFFITAVVAGVAAVVTQLVLGWTGTAPFAVVPFTLMQGQAFILTFLIAGFAALFGHATIYFMFVLPIKASWFIGLEIVLAFLYFLTYHDFAGFVGLCTTVGVGYMLFTGGGPKRFLHELRLRIERKWLERKLRKLRGQGGRGDVVQGPWIN